MMKWVLVFLAGMQFGLWSSSDEGAAFGYKAGRWTRNALGLPMDAEQKETPL